MNRNRGFQFVTDADRRRADLFWEALVGGGHRRNSSSRQASASWAPHASEATWTEETDFSSWPTLVSLPDDIVERVRRNREGVPVRTGELKEKTGGYFAIGKSFDPSELLTPAEQQSPRLTDILTRLHQELIGEGKTSAVMTGDGAGFTWGQGLAHGGALEPWVNKLFSAKPEAKAELLELGITLDGKTWKIVDTARKQVATGEAAIQLINGREPADDKRRLLSCFMHISEKLGSDAATAQWRVVKDMYFTGKVPQQVVDDTAWSAKAICYVIHCAMWGSFAGWDRFRSTGGDSKKILRLEAEFTPYAKNTGTYLLVPSERGTVSPSITMLRNMGHGYMIADGIVQPMATLAEARPGDVVFQMDKLSKHPFYGLRGVPPVYRPLEELMEAVLAVHHFSMERLLAHFDKIRDKGGKNKGYARLEAMRDYYASPDNPRKEHVGLRPRVAMDAVLHRGEGVASSGWLLKDCEYAALPPDQVELIKRKLGSP